MSDSKSITNMVENIQKYEPEQSASDMALMIQRFEPKIKKAILQTNPEERADLEQELKIKVIILALQYKWAEIPDISNYLRTD
ncbi:putative component of type VI protein secretion system [Salibacterium salarium]|uniref:hypothetical protein n=1 Tax=Salibacterium salarium TaxID=284579 RepID=UPI00278B64D8|nr:hypothetical protein [Salibacterium salarium]MDQ0297728.1 putative component of type VI protein secretion system [Salibacterium salarium]